MTSADRKWVLVPEEPTLEMIESYFRTCARHGFRAHINASCAWETMLAARPAAPAGEVERDTWRDDPAADERWNAGCDYAMQQLCVVLGVDPQSIVWDAATETLDGDVRAQATNVIVARFGDDWRTLYTSPVDPAAIRAEARREALEEGAKAGWNACRMSVYAVCEDVDAEADRAKVHEGEHAKGYAVGMARAAKSIARGFGSMEAEDDDNLAATIRALAGEPQAEGWKPIETAPKDGTVVDLHDGEPRWTDCYWGLPEHCCGEAGQYCDSDWHRLKPGWVDSARNEMLDDTGDPPTHWRPLPAPPSGGRDEG